MVQNPKGGGLSSSFGGGGSQQLGGVKKTGDFLDKSTWALATGLLVLILLSNATIGGTKTNVESRALDESETTISQPTEALPVVEDTTAPETTPPTDKKDESTK